MTFLPTSPIAIYLAAAVGPPSARLVDCKSGFKHSITMFTAERKTKAVARVAEYKAWCHPPKGHPGPACAVAYQPAPAKVLPFLQDGVEELKALLPKKKDLTDEDLAMARARGGAAHEALVAQGFFDNSDDDSEDAPPKKKARKTTNTDKGKAATRSAEVNLAKPKAIVVKAKGKDAKAKTAPVLELPAGQENIVDEYDEYSPLTHDTAGLPMRIVTLIIYATADCDPIQHVVYLRYLPAFNFGYFNIARQIEADSPSPVQFDRYCVFAGEFKRETLEPINMTDRGGYMVYRDASFTDAQCPGIRQWITRAESVATYNYMDSDSQEDPDDAPDQQEHTLDTANNEPEFDSDIEIISSTCTPSSCTKSGSGSTSSQPRPLKRARRQFVEGSSRVPFKSAFIDSEEKWWAKESKD
ncbi:hypothetical protein DFH09DRAFT_1338894 [Mycena vulgaris]|nr:hypothetical protein DFH09DRAFT_1346015 [Mycena vulgaris]KAJ6467229.1 hypothetical protein DFH09DRAFT_1483459 [Mycena vulgaris]KAJ6489473.1 hypothetical protein DFH09DRAFT_1338894 [Mycena vulgaris]